MRKYVSIQPIPRNNRFAWILFCFIASLKSKSVSLYRLTFHEIRYVHNQIFIIYFCWTNSWSIELNYRWASRVAWLELLSRVNSSYYELELAHRILSKSVSVYRTGIRRAKYFIHTSDGRVELFNTSYSHESSTRSTFLWTQASSVRYPKSRILIRTARRLIDLADWPDRSVRRPSEHAWFAAGRPIVLRNPTIRSSEIESSHNSRHTIWSKLPTKFYFSIILITLKEEHTE